MKIIVNSVNQFHCPNANMPYKRSTFRDCRRKHKPQMHTTTHKEKGVSAIFPLPLYKSHVSQYLIFLNCVVQVGRYRYHPPLKYFSWKNTAEEQEACQKKSDLSVKRQKTGKVYFIWTDEELICNLFLELCKLENHLHALPPSAAPHWLTGWKTVIPLVAGISSPLMASFQSRPTFSLFRPPFVAFGSSLAPSWKAQPPIG